MLLNPRNVLKKRFLKQVIFIALLCLFIVNVLDFDLVIREKPDKEHYLLYNITVERYYQRRKYWMTTNLGSILFKNKPNIYSQLNRTFDVLVYRYPYYTEQYLKECLNFCPVKNCIFTSNESTLILADAVVIMLARSENLPWIHKRNPLQRWVLITLESPTNDIESYPMMLEHLAGHFNWSMTYRSDSDVPIPYGRVVPLHKTMVKKMYSKSITSYIPFWKLKQREVLAVAMISHCSVRKRLNYIYELQKYIKVDLFGACAKTISMKMGCPGHVQFDCGKLQHYLFYLGFENSNCRQYITEKVFHSALVKGAIPVVMGAPVSDYEKLLPPHSFLHVNSYISPRDLAMELINLSKNDEYLLEYHQWRRYFKIVNEHNSFGRIPYDLCRLCQALNYNDNETKVYDLDMLRLYFDPKLLCESDAPEPSSPNPPVTYTTVTSPKPTKKLKGPRRACKKKIILL